MKKIWKILILLGIILASFILDDFFFELFNLLRGENATGFFLFITQISSHLIVILLLFLLFSWSSNKRRWIMPLGAGIFVSYLITLIVKVVVQRARPYQTGIIEAPLTMIKEAHLSWDFSFPSAHTALAFAAIPVLSKEYPKLKYAWITFAVIVAISRVYFGVHYLSDTVFGAIVGYYSSLGVLKLREKLRR